MSKLILTRHGQSIWNAENRFTGWVDVDLSKKGVEEAEKSGELIKNLIIKIESLISFFANSKLLTIETKSFVWFNGFRTVPYIFPFLFLT